MSKNLRKKAKRYVRNSRSIKNRTIHLATKMTSSDYYVESFDLYKKEIDLRVKQICEKLK